MLHLHLIYGSKFGFFDDLEGFSENCEGEIAMNYVSGLKKLTLFVSLQMAQLGHFRKKTTFEEKNQYENCTILKGF